MSAVVDVSDVLKAHQRRKGDDLPTASVSRPLEPDLIDCGNLLIVDSNRIEAGDKGNLETVLKDVARDNAQVRLRGCTFCSCLYSNRDLCSCSSTLCGSCRR